MRKNITRMILWVIPLIFVSPVFAKIGVGVATGKIVIDEVLKPGTIYDIPPLTVMNTGDETTTYNLNVSYHDQQPEMRPDKSWFTFTPAEFTLEPGSAQPVLITLNVPVKVNPGQYFAYLEGVPAKKAQDGQTSVGIAAAAKLYFQIAPANVIAGVYYRAISFWKMSQPWGSIIAGVTAVVLIVMLLKRNFNFTVAKKSKTEKNG